MASTVVGIRDKVKARLRISGAASEPTNTQIEGFVLEAAKRAFAELPPIYETETLVLDDLSAAVPDMRQPLFVQSDREALLPHEWTRHPDKVKVRSYAVARPGENLMVWHTSNVDINVTDPFDSSCALGQDWLEDYIIELASKTTLGHMVNMSGSVSGELHGQSYRVSQDEVNAIHMRLEKERARFELMFREALSDRAVARPPLRQSALRGYRNRSRRMNRAAS